MKKQAVLWAILIVLAFLASPVVAAEDKAKDFIKEAAQGGLFEVEAGKLASANASKPEVKQFGNLMVTDHGKANEGLTAIAKAKGIEVPKEPGNEHKAHLEKLKNAGGAEFDRTYMDIMVKDHEKDVDKFRKTSEKMDDPEVKAWIVKTLPVLEKHLKSAQELNKTM